MRFAVYLPWLLSVLVALPGVAAMLRGLPDRLDPRPVLMALTTSLAALTAATTASLALLAVAGASTLAAPDSSLASSDGHADPGALPVGAVAAGLLGVALVRAGRVAWHRWRQHRGLRASVDLALPSAADGTVFVEDDAIFALATPSNWTSPGRVVVSRGMWTALDDQERAAVVAHEQEHLVGAHHRHLAVAAVAIALNPLLAPWWSDVVHAAERCADEGAARRLGDRRLVARAVGRAALSVRSRRTPATSKHQPLADLTTALGVATGSVPRRVAALQAGWDRSHHSGPHLAPALLVGAVLVTSVALSAAGATHAAWDLHDLLGTLAR